MYATSKIGLSTYSRILARENSKIFVANVCPGFVNTTMNDNKGPRSIDQGAFIASYFSDCDLKNYKSGHRKYKNNTFFSQNFLKFV